MRKAMKKWGILASGETFISSDDKRLTEASITSMID